MNENQHQYLKAHWPQIVLIIAIVTFLGSLDERAHGPGDAPMSRTAMIHYLSLIAIGVSGTTLAWRFWSWPWTRTTGSVVTAAAVFMFGYFDTYKEEWWPQRSPRDVIYTETYHRWSHRHLPSFGHL